MISVRLNGVSAHIMADVVLRHTPAWMNNILDEFILNCHMQQFPFGTGNLCKQPFPHAVLTLCRHSMISKICFEYFFEKMALLDLRFGHTPSLICRL